MIASFYAEALRGMTLRPQGPGKAVLSLSTESDNLFVVLTIGEMRRLIDYTSKELDKLEGTQCQTTKNADLLN